MRHQHTPKRPVNLWRLEQPQTSWMNILQELVATGSPQTIIELESVTGIPKNSLWVRLDRMRKQGFVRKIEQDRQVKWLPTPIGVQVAQSV